MKIVTLVEMTDTDIKEAISEWAKKKFKKKNLGEVELEALELSTDLPLHDTGAYAIRAKFELSDKEKDDEDGLDINR